MSSSSAVGVLSFAPWSVDQTAAELFRTGLIDKEDARMLQAQEVDGAALPFLSDEALVRMGVATFGRRVRVLRAAQAVLDAEALRQGKRAPVLLGASGPVGAAQAAQQQQAANYARNDPYGLGPSSSPSAAALSASSRSAGLAPGRFDFSDEDANLLDPAALTPASSVRNAQAGLQARAGRFAESLRDPPMATRDFGVSQRFSSALHGGMGVGAHSTALRLSDRYDVDRDRDAEEAFADAADTDDAPVGGYDSDVDRQFVNPRLDAQRAAFDPNAPAADPDDPFGALGGSTAARPWLGAIVAPSRPPPFVADPPTKRLVLEWVHGYRAFDSRSNLVYNAAGDIIYPVAGICVVYRPSLRSQKHFLGHTDDVRCLAQHPADANLIASGQSGGTKEGVALPPHICVWDSSSSDLSRSYTLQCTLADRSIRAVGFSGGQGRFLASVSSDQHHSLKIWDWRKRLLLTAAKSDTNAVFMVKGNPRDESEFVTVGKFHALFWHFDGVTLRNKRAIFAGSASTSSASSSASKSRGGADANSPVSFYSIAFSERGYACLGSSDGSILVFVNGKCAKTFAGVHRGKLLTLEWYRGGFVSGGSDGRVHVLDKKMDVVKSFQFSNKVTSVHIGGEGGPNGGDSLLVGTQGADVFEVKDPFAAQIDDGDEGLEAVTRGHSDGELWGLAVAADGKHFVTAGEDNTLCLWSSTSHRLLKRGIISDRKGHVLAFNGLGGTGKRGGGPRVRGCTSTHPVNQCARAVAVAPAGGEILVGTNEGELVVFDTRTFARKHAVDLAKYKKENLALARRSAVDGRGPRRSANEAHPGNNSREHWISCISFSPSGHAVAVGTHGSVVVLLDATAGYAVRAVLDRSNTPITALDWSADGTLLATNDMALELLYYHVDEQNLAAVAAITNAASVRDVVWATRSTPLSWASSGVTPPHLQGQFVNSADANASRTLIVTGDDSGLVKLWRSPALPGAVPHVYTGHSAHVTQARFSADERYVITAGGFDNSICQWAVV